MPSQIKTLNGDSTDNPNLLRKQNPVNSTTKSSVSSKMSGGTGGNPTGKKTNQTTMNAKSVSTSKAKFQMGTTHHAPGTVPEYLKSK